LTFSEEDNQDSDETQNNRHNKYAKVFGSSSLVLAKYSPKKLKSMAMQLHAYDLPDPADVIYAEDKAFDSICTDVIEDKKFGAHVRLLRGVITSHKTQVMDLHVEETSDSSVVEPSCDNASQESKASCQKFWKIEQLKLFCTGFKEKANSVTTFNDKVILHKNLRPVSLQMFNQCVTSCANYFGLVLSACFQENYLQEHFEVDSSYRVDQAGLFMVRLLANQQSKKTYNDSKESSPSVLCRKKVSFEWPETLESICMQVTAFTGTVKEFRACIGWYQTKYSLIKNMFSCEANKPTKELAPPFSYEAYRDDVQANTRANEKEITIAQRSSSLNGRNGSTANRSNTNAIPIVSLDDIE